MANVNISINTESEEMILTVDGQVISNICCVNIYNYEYNKRKELSIGIEIHEEMTGDMTKRSYISKNGVSDPKITITPSTSKNALDDALLIDPMF